MTTPYKVFEFELRATLNERKQYETLSAALRAQLHRLETRIRTLTAAERRIRSEWKKEELRLAMLSEDEGRERMDAADQREAWREESQRERKTWSGAPESTIRKASR